MIMSRRSRLKPIDRKAAILKVAIKLFNQKGYQNTTMADLVEASGLSFGGFYHHYRHKADILLDIMRQGNQVAAYLRGKVDALRKEEK